MGTSTRSKSNSPVKATATSPVKAKKAKPPPKPKSSAAKPKPNPKITAEKPLAKRKPAQKKGARASPAPSMMPMHQPPTTADAGAYSPPSAMYFPQPQIHNPNAFPAAMYGPHPSYPPPGAQDYLIARHDHQQTLARQHYQRGPHGEFFAVPGPATYGPGHSMHHLPIHSYSQPSYSEPYNSQSGGIPSPQKPLEEMAPTPEAAYGIDPANLSLPLGGRLIPALEVDAEASPPTLESASPPTTPPPTTPPVDIASSDAVLSQNPADDITKSKRGRANNGPVTKRRRATQDPRNEDEDKREYPSRTNPVFDTIIGVGQGDIPEIEMPRCLELDLKTPIPSISRHYARKVNDLLTRAENLGVRTDSWIYVAALHPNSKTEFYHYASPQLRSDDPNGVKSIHQAVSTVMHRLSKTLKRGKVEIQTQLTETEKKMKLEAARADRAEAKTKKLDEGIAAILKTPGIDVGAAIMALRAKVEAEEQEELETLMDGLIGFGEDLSGYEERISDLEDDVGGRAVI